MQKDLFQKFDDWFRIKQKRGLFIAVLSGEGARKRRAGWEWTELKVDSGAKVKDLYRLLAEAARLMKGTSK